MNFPIIVLSYGDFSQNKKLFFYEDNGVSLFPIFTDPNSATSFRKYMQKILNKNGDNRYLVCMGCNDRGYAKDMLEMVCMMIPELQTIIFDPMVPNQRRRFTISSRMSIQDFIQEISPVSNVE